MTLNNVKYNPFQGEGDNALCFKVIYNTLMMGKHMTYEDFTKEAYKLKYPNSSDFPENYTKESRSFGLYCTIRKQIEIIKRLIPSIQSRGTKGRIFWYDSEDKDPLRELRQALIIRDVDRYAQFCQDSAGLIPMSWLEYFFKNTRDLLNIKQVNTLESRGICADVNHNMQNIELLPRLYEAIKNKFVLMFDYIDSEGRIFNNLIFHPQLLKEFEGQWHLCGETNGFDNISIQPIYNIDISRIQANTLRITDVEPYRNANKGFYEEWFHNCVGLKHNCDALPTHVRARALNSIMYDLLRKRKIHHSQEETLPFGEHLDGTYAEFDWYVELNREFIGKILRYGRWIQIIGDNKALELFKEEISNLSKLYI